MIRAFLLSICLITLLSCEKADLTSACAGYTRAESVRKEFAEVRLQNIRGQQTRGYVIYPLSESYRSYIVSWVPCNLPIQFQKDTLSIVVSGYKLIRPDSQAVKMAEQPFEITDIKLRK